ncbi:winged helix-turn-helix domain-containing protein [Empedobacter brevis]|uniref:winged helix-turn-helix domain-containing protein n=1 Tax=Empedobacter brevis TaxID=247 RepID=UPI001624BD0B|nr:winged helix-turn-helix domain-containing protein [Empedobacter brevis]
MNLEIKKTVNQKLLQKKSYTVDQAGIDFNIETKYLTLLSKNGFVKQDMKDNGQSVIGNKYDLTDKGADFINIFQDLINI